jgi:hypothetical protein
MKKGLIITLVILVLFFLFFGRTPFALDLVYSFFNHVLSWILGIGFSISLIVGVVKLANFSDGAGKAWLATLAFAILWTPVLIFQRPLMRYALYQNTEYKQTETLVAQNETRDVPYTVAATNFIASNPDSMTKPGDLDYVNGEWISSIDPKGFWNTLKENSNGYFVYQPENPKKVGFVRESMPFAENGWGRNSSSWFVKSLGFKEYFSEFHEVLYVQDENADEMLGVISLIKRKGFTRWPYVSEVLVIHSDGRVEKLSPTQAENDDRLAGIALEPEWLTNEKTLAYGYRYGVNNALFRRQGRIQVQVSSVNDENSAPFHLETVEGNMWFTPFSPRNGTTLIGIAMEYSHDINGPVYIWNTPNGEGYKGADYLASLIEGSPNHEEISWYRTGGDGASSGNKTVLEVVPVVRSEADGNHLYFLGYTSPAPKSVEVSFYTVVDPISGTVYEDLFKDSDLESWLRGEFELQPQIASSTTNTCTATPVGLDLPSMSSQELIAEMQLILEELSKRNK